MKSTLNLFLVLIIITFFSCSKEKEEFTDQFPGIPDAIVIDVNEDGLIDYTISYHHSFIYSPNSSTGIFGEICSIDGNEVLNNRDEGILFVRDLENIRATVSEPIFWESARSSRCIISIQNNTDGNWPTEWEINSDSDHSTYFIGLRLNNNMTELGWIELDINTTSGAIKLVDKGML